MGKTAKAKSPFPTTVYVTLDGEAGEEFFIAEETIDTIGDNVTVGVYTLVSVQTVAVTRELL
jgi:hypothetical protein